MTPLRYIFGTIWVLFVWLIVAIFGGMIVEIVFPSSTDTPAFIGIGLEWRNLPGTILGFFAARQSWRIHVKRQRQKPQTDRNSEPDYDAEDIDTHSRQYSHRRHRDGDDSDGDSD